MAAIQQQLREGIADGSVPYQHILTAKMLKQDPDEVLNWTGNVIDHIEKHHWDDSTLHALHAGLQLGYQLGRAAADDERL